MTENNLRQWYENIQNSPRCETWNAFVSFPTRGICFFQILPFWEKQNYDITNKNNWWWNFLFFIFLFIEKNHFWTIYTFSLSDKTVNTNIFCIWTGVMTQAKVLHSRSTWTAEIFCICSCVLVYLYLRICICVKRFQGQATFAFMQRNAKEDSTDC